jgi:hypothetical protein
VAVVLAAAVAFQADFGWIPRPFQHLTFRLPATSGERYSPSQFFMPEHSTVSHSQKRVTLPEASLAPWCSPPFLSKWFTAHDSIYCQEKTAIFFRLRPLIIVSLNRRILRCFSGQPFKLTSTPRNFVCGWSSQLPTASPRRDVPDKRYMASSGSGTFKG